MSPRKKSTPSKPGTGHRRSSRGSAPASQSDDFEELPARPMSRLEMEQQMAELSRILSEQEFTTADEANEFLQNLLAESGGRLPHREPETPQEKAAELILQAQDAPERRARKLIKDALKLDPNCSDAYIMQGDMADSLPNAIKFYRQAVAAGERAAGPENFAKNKGHFWGILETRPYMRALQTLASALWFYGEADEAIELFQTMLELNPDDNQGARYPLLNALLMLRRHEDALALLDEYDDGTAHWLFNRALQLFRVEGRSKQAREAMQDALDANELIADMLLGFEEMADPEEMSDLIGFGDESEATAYVAMCFALWVSTPGAQYWLQENLE